ncbi:MAG: RNA polymerase factor sigma-54 [Bacteroidales bacterium]|nr:RNA polymerase factor sigma-54 [Bacteroidales bacterium]MCL2133400.1 RNA polymerase factor sigma-54 [Bacteroidales bacterium]
MLKQVLQQSLQQKLSPKQVQVVRMLQLPVLQLEQRIEKELEENPALEEVITCTEEEEGNISIDEYVNHEPSARIYNTFSSSGAVLGNFPTLSAKESLQEQLEMQLRYLHLNEQQLAIALFLIRSLDTDGYLRRNMASLVDDIAFHSNIETSEQELEAMLKTIQHFEPIGVAARNLQECLLIQLENKEQTIAVVTAITILFKQFENFSNRAFDRIKEKLQLSDENFKEALNVITHLNPKPGASIDNIDDRMNHVIPDFLLEMKNGEFQLIMPRYTIPDLRINRRYQDMLKREEKAKTKQDKEMLIFLRQKIESAKWFIDALKQRQDTLMHTMQAILDYQSDYFREGDESLLRPMALKHIAAMANLDISTISRVAASKYIQTHFGIFSLKHFFSDGATNDSGEEMSIRNVKKILIEFIEEEDKANPLSDEELAEMMQKRGFSFARRTIAKYREQLNIPTSRVRKRSLLLR